MDDKQMGLYLDRIGELVIDEDKIVTYKSLSKILDVHVNTAKQLLYTYLSKQKNESSVPISATYLLAGKLADGSFNITVLNETDLESSYGKFIEITSEHVYSIQKGKHVKEIQMLCGIDKQIQNVNSSGVIKCSKSILKTENNDDKKTDHFTKGGETKSPIKIKPVEEKDKETVSGKIESCSKTNPKGNISKRNKEKETGNTKKQSGNIAAFFFNGAQKNLDKSKNILKTKNNSPGKDETKSSVVSVKAETVEKEEKNKVESQSKENVKKKSGTSKRKRIQMFSDSEESNESDNEEPPPLMEEEFPEPMPLSVILEEEDISKDQPRNKKKKRKIINKVTVGEDGFIETKKEEVIETDSEDEVAEKVAPSKKEDSTTKKLKLETFNEKRKTSSSKTTKVQSSLLAFLKKN